jgi:hypothetical protein
MPGVQTRWDGRARWLDGTIAAEGGTLGVVAAVSAVAFEFAARGLVAAPGLLPAAAWMAWVVYWTWPLPLPALAVLLLLFPDGRLPSPHWRLVPWLLGVTFGGVTVWTMLRPGPMALGVVTVTNPAGIAALEHPLIEMLGDVPGILVTTIALAGSVGAAVAPFVRWRRAEATERQQLKWLALAAGVSGSAGAAGFLVTGFGSAPIVGGLLLLLAFAGVVIGIPTAVGVAILRLRQEIDLETLTVELLAVAEQHDLCGFAASPTFPHRTPACCEFVLLVTYCRMVWSWQELPRSCGYHSLMTAVTPAPAGRASSRRHT